MLTWRALFRCRRRRRRRRRWRVHGDRGWSTISWKGGWKRNFSTEGDNRDFERLSTHHCRVEEEENGKMNVFVYVCARVYECVCV